MAFVGSPLEVDTNEFTKLAKRLKKEKVSIDIVIFGEEVRRFLLKIRFPFFLSLVIQRKIRRIYYND